MAAITDSTELRKMRSHFREIVLVKEAIQGLERGALTRKLWECQRPCQSSSGHIRWGHAFLFPY